MAGSKRDFFSPIADVINGIGNSFSVAREMNAIYNTPESVFRARGTTRDAAIRAAAKRL